MACGYVLQLNSRVAHVAGPTNAAADFLLRLELNVMKKIREDLKTIPFEAHTSSFDMAEEAQFFFTLQDNEEAET